MALGGGPVQADIASADCPKEMPTGTRCYTGVDENNAYYWIAIPANDNWRTSREI